MIPFPSGMFNGGYEPYGDPGWLFGVSMFRDADWEVVGSDLHLRDFKTGNFAYNATEARREDNGSVRCWVPNLSTNTPDLSFTNANASWASLLQACVSGVSIVLAGYSKVTENVLTAAGSDIMCHAGFTMTYKVSSPAGTTRTFWYQNRAAPYNGAEQFAKLQFYTPADAEAGVGYYHDSVPGCVTTPANSGVITTPGYASPDFVMVTLSLTSSGPRMNFNTDALTRYSSGGADGTGVDVRPAGFNTLVGACSIKTNAAMRTMFAGIYNEPLSSNPAKLAEIYNALKNQHN